MVRKQNFDQQIPLSKSLSKNRDVLQSIYMNCSDVIFRTFLIGGKTEALLIYIEGITDIEEIDLHILSPLMQEPKKSIVNLKEAINEKISVSKTITVNSFNACVEYLSNGNPILFFDGDNNGIAFGLSKWEKRSVEEPTAETSIRGPREGFTETLGVNMSQIRRRIKSPALKMESMTIGRFTKTSINISYMDGIADPTLVEEVKNRLQRIDIDGILESGYIEELIEDNPFSPFPQLLATERPDVACSSLLEGRVVILMAGTPFVLIAPVTLFSLLQSAEDYYHRFLFSSTIRWMRYLFIAISLLLPSLYVAVLTFHQEMVPTNLLMSMASSREAVPFPAIMEALIMEITFEGLREAGVRLPKQIGAAVSIVGALVIGQAAVQAGLVSAPMVIVVAITGIASFMIPRYVVGLPFRLLRFPIIFLAGSLGLLGVMLGIIGIIVHLSSLRSFGVPYLSPVASSMKGDLKDVIFRAPWWMMNTRPNDTGKRNVHRQSANQKPGPLKGNDP